MTVGMSDTDIYRVMYKHNAQPDKWRHFISRSNGEGFYVRLTSAQNAIKQIQYYTTETKIQKLGPKTYWRFAAGVEYVNRVELDWFDVYA